MDDIIARLHALTTANRATTPSPVATARPVLTAPPPTSAIDNLEYTVNQMILGDINSPPPPSPPSAPATSTGFSVPEGDLKRLWSLDEKFDCHMKSIILCFDSLASPDPSSQHAVEVDLTAEKRWFQESIQELHQLERHHDPEICVLAEAMCDRMAQFIAAIDFCIEILQSRSPPYSSQHIVNSDSYFATNLRDKHTPSLVAILNILAQNLFGHATRTWCNANLRSHKLFWEEIMTEGGRIPSVHDTKLHHNFPTDLRSARQSLQIEPDIVKYAACSTCCNIYPPKKSGKIMEWPTECTWRRFPDSPPCGQPLVKSGVEAGESIRVPIRPFEVQDFDSFVGRLLCRPGYEKILDEGTSLSNQSGELNDIKDGLAIRDLKGPDGKPFLDGFKRSELRLAWSLSVDWFNPFHNKQAGKKASCGSIAMLLLNLPPSLRNKPENIYINAVAPKEPTNDQTNHYLDPLIDMMEHNYQHGTHYTKTRDNPREGRSCRSMIAVEVFDLVGVKRVLGHCSFRSNHNFCSHCTMSKADIGNFDWQNWQPRKREDLRAAAEAWRDAPSAAARKELYAKHGVRWSPLWRLSYFDPVRSVVVDGMHNIFEGLVKYHCRVVLGIDTPDPEPTEEKAADPVKLSSAIELFERAPTRNTLERFTIPVLKALCLHNNLALPDVGTRKLKKAQILDVLEGFLKKQAQSTAVPSKSPSSAEPANAPSLIGDEYIEDLIAVSRKQANERQQNQWAVGDDAINSKELKHIHSFISQTTRPSWHTPPPSNLGEAKHGKPKADQWRSCMEFDVPAAMAQIWDFNKRGCEDERARRQKKLSEATILLATAIRWATSYCTSAHRALQYMVCMVAYLNILKDLYPNLAWLPNHHAALHIGPFLLNFGPMHGWWMFVYERIIGWLGKTNTNFKIGELEGTMLETFCASVNFKALLLHHHDMAVVKKFMAIMDDATKDRSRDPLAGIMLDADAGVAPSSTPSKRATRGITLSERALGALNTMYHQLFNKPMPAATICLPKHIVGKVSFATRAQSTRDCNVFFRSTLCGFMAPGVIQFIVSIPSIATTSKRDTFFVIERYAQLMEDGTSNPFSSHKDFGASLWSSKMSAVLEAVPVDHIVCHAILRPWVKDVILFKALDRAF